VSRQSIHVCATTTATIARTNSATLASPGGCRPWLAFSGLGVCVRR
jgi:hypothetical protein